MTTEQSTLKALILTDEAADYLKELLLNHSVKGTEALLHGQIIYQFSVLQTVTVNKPEDTEIVN